MSDEFYNWLVGEASERLEAITEQLETAKPALVSDLDIANLTITISLIEQAVKRLLELPILGLDNEK